jgi:hypothetical protein
MSALFVTGGIWGDVNNKGKPRQKWKRGSVGFTFESSSVAGFNTSYTGTSEPLYIIRHKKW